MFTEGLDKNALRWVREVIFTHYCFFFSFSNFDSFMVYENGFVLIYLYTCKVMIFILFCWCL